MLLEGLEILTMAPGSRPVRGSIRIRDGRIVAAGDVVPEAGEEVRAMDGLTALPGFVQGHVHLCQTLFRNLAEARPLLPWLRERIWPLEAAHDETTLRSSARLGLFELARGGCTTFQAMETVRGTEFVFDEVARSGLRAVLGNALMDTGDAPRSLLASTRDALATSQALREAWDGTGGRLFYAFNPRFILACTDPLLREVARLRETEGARVHTHAAEHPDEVEAVREARGRPCLLALDELGILGPETSIAHCVHLDGDETEALAGSGAAVLHCPTTNLKLGSGIAPIAAYRRRGIRVALGSDGAPANNRLDALTELRQAALLQDVTSGAGALAAFDALSLLTLDGARALGFGDECGSIEAGKVADLVLVDLRDPALGPGGDPYTKVVYGADRSHVRHVLSAGRFVVEDGVVLGVEPERLAREAGAALAALLARADLHR